MIRDWATIFLKRIAQPQAGYSLDSTELHWGLSRFSNETATVTGNALIQKQQVYYVAIL